VTTTESTAAPIAGIAPEDPLRVAERLRDEFRAGAAERDRERKFPYEQCAAFRRSCARDDPAIRTDVGVRAFAGTARQRCDPLPSVREKLRGCGGSAHSAQPARGGVRGWTEDAAAQ